MRVLKVVGINFLLVALIMLAAEFALRFFAIKPDKPFIAADNYGSDPGPYIRVERLLGYAPTPNYTLHNKTYFGTEASELIYDATYRFDQHSLRVSSVGKGQARQRCVAFYGCSFTLGEGVNDSETLPSQTALISQGRIQSVNFGFQGYGVHQMLASIEAGDIIKKAPCKPDTIVYQALDVHVLRAQGFSPWDDGPYYELKENGVPYRKGKFSDNFAGCKTGNATLTNVIAWLNQSRLLENTLLFNCTQSRYEKNRVFFESEAALAAKMVAKAKNLVKIVGIKDFHILYWDTAPPNTAVGTALYLEALRQEGLQVDLVSKNLQDFSSEKYLFPHDGHPNPLAHGKNAEFLVDKLLGRGNLAKRL